MGDKRYFEIDVEAITAAYGKPPVDLCVALDSREQSIGIREISPAATEWLPISKAPKNESLALIRRKVPDSTRYAHKIIAAQWANSDYWIGRGYVEFALINTRGEAAK